MKQRVDAKWEKVWDPVVRLFHWTTLVLFCAAYASAELGQNEIHLVVGYILAAVLVGRIVWGFVGSQYARFINFLYGPVATLRYAQSLIDGQPEHYPGHNPLGAAMVFALLGLLSLLVVTGLILTAALEFEGPLLFLNRFIDDATAYRILGVHHLAVNVVLACVFFHVLGVGLASWQHHENLVLAMITGKKPIQSRSQTISNLTSNPLSNQGIKE